MSSQAAQRQQLFAGAEPRTATTSSETPVDLASYSTDEVVEMAVRTHRETTESLQNGLKAIEKSKVVQAEIAKDIHKQGVQLERVGGQIEEVRHKLTYAEKLLRYMRQWCCCGDPELAKEAKWAKDTKRLNREEEANPPPPIRVPTTNPFGNAGGDRRTTNDSGNGDGAAGPVDRGPDTSGLNGTYDSAARQIDGESRKQAVLLDQIIVGLDGLKDGAQGMRDALQRQDPTLLAVTDATEATNMRISNINNNSQLREFQKRK